MTDTVKEIESAKKALQTLNPNQIHALLRERLSGPSLVQDLQYCRDEISKIEEAVRKAQTDMETLIATHDKILARSGMRINYQGLNDFCIELQKINQHQPGEPMPQYP